MKLTAIQQHTRNFLLTITKSHFQLARESTGCQVELDRNGVINKFRHLVKLIFFFYIEFILPKNYYEKLQIVSGKISPNRADSDESP